MEIKKKLNKTKNIRILVVDDDRYNRLIIKRLLKDNISIEIDEAKDGKEAVDKFISKKYDIVFMDVQMPQMGGHAATKLIREWENDREIKNTPIIALTARSFRKDINNSLDAGCTDHLVKPVREKRLIDIIKKHIKKEFVINNYYIDEKKMKKIFDKNIPIILEEAKKYIKAIDKDLEKSDFNHIQELAHKMKGTAGCYQLDNIYNLYLSLENFAIKEDSEGIKSILDKISKYSHVPESKTVFSI